jgi:thiamine kinase-like enzyme
MITKNKMILKFLVVFLIYTTFSYADDIEIIQNIFKNNFSKDISQKNISIIQSGLTNHNYLISIKNKKYFVRIGTEHSSALGINRKKEKKFHEIASNLQITPSLLYFDVNTGNMVLDFIENNYYGKVEDVWVEEKLEVLTNLINLIKKYHAVKINTFTDQKIKIQKILNLYKECIKANANLPKNIKKSIKFIQSCESKIPVEKAVLCHNDLFFQNILNSSNNKLWLIDWEYADWGCRYFDLAGLCVEHRLTKEERKLVCYLYFGNKDKDFEKLELMYMLYSLKTSLWGFLQKAKCPNMEFDILKIANFHYQNFITSMKSLNLEK